MCDDEHVPKSEVQERKKVEEKKGEERKVKGEKAEGRHVEGKKPEGRNIEGKKAEERNVESKEAEERNVESKKAERKVESKKAEERKVESKKAEERKVESKKAEERKVESKKAEERKIESRKAVERNVESKKAEERKSVSKKVVERKVESKKAEERNVESKKAEGRKFEANKPEGRKFEVKKAEGRKVEEKQAEETQLALNPKPRMEDPNSKPSRKAKRIIPTRGGLAIYPRYPSEDIREEVNDRARRREALSGSGKNKFAVSFSSEDELTSARNPPKDLSERNLNLSKPRTHYTPYTPYTPRKANLSEDDLEQPKQSRMVGSSATNEDVSMLDSKTPEGDGVEVPRTRQSNLRPTRGTPRGRGAGRPRVRGSTTRNNPSTPRRAAGDDHGGFGVDEDDNSTMPVTRASRYQTRAAQPIASEPAPYHTYPPRRYLEVSVQRFELPDDRPQGPGNLWACQRPGCGFKEHNAVSAEGLERVRSHIQHHADEDAKREPFFANPFRDDPNHPNHIPAWAYVIH